MLEAMLATAVGTSTGATSLPVSGDWYLPNKEVTGTLGSAKIFAMNPFVFCEPNRHFIPVTEQQATVMSRALARTSEVLDKGFLVD